MNDRRIYSLFPPLGFTDGRIPPVAIIAIVRAGADVIYGGYSVCVCVLVCLDGAAMCSAPRTETTRAAGNGAQLLFSEITERIFV